MKQLSLLLFLSFLTAACGTNNSHAAVVPERPLFRLEPGDLVLAALEDDIPALMVDDSHFVPAEKADLDPQDLVVGLLIGGEPRAYPVRLLSLHEVVNDRVNQQAIAVTWCPLCYSAVVFQRVVEGKELRFRASGYLLDDNLVLVDHPTNTLWSQLLGQGIKGALKNTLLKIVPSTLTTWEIWRENYPETRLLAAEKLGYSGEVPDPYSGYFASGAAGLGSTGEVDPRLAAKDLVLGISQGNFQIAFPLEMIESEGIIDYQQGGNPVVIRWDPDLETARVFDGTSPREREIPSQIVYWFAWSALFPRTEVYSPD